MTNIAPSYLINAYAGIRQTFFFPCFQEQTHEVPVLVQIQDKENVDVSFNGTGMITDANSPYRGLVMLEISGGTVSGTGGFTLWVKFPSIPTKVPFQIKINYYDTVITEPPVPEIALPPMSTSSASKGVLTGLGLDSVLPPMTTDSATGGNVSALVLLLTLPVMASNSASKVILTSLSLGLILPHMTTNSGSKGVLSKIEADLVLPSTTTNSGSKGVLSKVEADLVLPSTTTNSASKGVLTGLRLSSITDLDGLITFHDVGASDTVTTKLDQAFTASDVNTTSGNLALALPFNYSPVDRESAGVSRVGTPVYYSGTGTPPSLAGGGNLQPNTRYYLIRNAAGTETEIYPENVQNNTAGLVDYAPFENVLPCVNLYQGVNKLMLTSGGTGTHRFFTLDLVTRIPNKASMDLPLEITDPNFNAKLEVVRENGCLGLKFPGNLSKITRAPSVNGSGIGKSIRLSFPNGKTPFRNLWALKRYWLMGNCLILRDEPVFDLRKIIIKPSEINATTGVISYDGYTHGFPVGVNGITEITITKTAGSTLPPAMPEYNGATDTTRTTLWLRGLTAGSTSPTFVKGTLTLHASYADCKANTNPITYGGGTGSGEFILASYNLISSKPEEHYLGTVDAVLQWLLNSPNGKLAQRQINQTYNTGIYVSSLQGPTNAEITSGLQISTRGITGVFPTGQTQIGNVATTMPLGAYPMRMRMSPNGVYPYCTTWGRRITTNDTIWMVNYPTLTSGRAWPFATKAEAVAWAATPGLTTSMTPSNALVFDSSQYNFANPSANNGFYGTFCWYLGTEIDGFDRALIGTSNVVPSMTRMTLVPLGKPIFLWIVLDVYDLDPTAVRSCSIDLTSATVGTTYSVTINGITYSYTAVDTSTTNTLNGLVTAVASSATLETRVSATRMEVYSVTPNPQPFSISVSANLTLRLHIKYKIFCNYTEITNGWENYDNSDVRFTELLQPNNFVDAPTTDPLYAACLVIYGSPAQPHVGFFGVIFCMMLAASNVNPIPQMLQEIMPIIETKYNLVV